MARAVIEVDPDAAERRRQEAESRRRVELRPTDEHTADLCGRDLPAAQALAADARITALAKALKADGQLGTLAVLRAQVYLALLLGTCPTPHWPAATDLPDHPTDLYPDENDYSGGDGNSPATGTADRSHPGCGEGDACGHGHTGEHTGDGDGDMPGGDRDSGGDRSKEETADGGGDAPGPDDAPDDALGVDEHPGADPDAESVGEADGRVPGRGPGGPNSGFGAGVEGLVRVIVPIGTLAGWSQQPGEVPGFGPAPASVARTLAVRAAGTRWHYTIVDAAGRAVSGGMVRHDWSDAGYRKLLADIAGRAANAPPGCEYETISAPGSGPVLRHEQGSYRPGKSLQRWIETWDRRCRFPDAATGSSL